MQESGVARNWICAKRRNSVWFLPASLSTFDTDIEAAIAADRRAECARCSTNVRVLNGLRGELLGVDGAAATVVPQYARYADLCILGRDVPDGPASVNYTFSEQLLFGTGRPVLFVPGHRAFGSLGQHIAVAWNSSRPAARSLNDALPLIERAEKTTVIMINPSGFIDAHEGPPGEQMIDHLRRHGAAVEAVRVEDVPHSDIAGCLQREAQIARRRSFGSWSFWSPPFVGKNAGRRHSRATRQHGLAGLHVALAVVGRLRGALLYD